MKEKLPGTAPMEICDIFSIGPTGRGILDLLMRTRKKLSVSEITACVNRSERAVRTHLKSLFDLGLVCRERSVTRHGKVAHKYFAPRAKDMVKSARREMLKRLHNLEKLLRGGREG